jgi:hypothetical protein
VGIEEEQHLKAVIAAIALKQGVVPCNCGWAFEQDCRRTGCTPAQMDAAIALASLIKLPLEGQ